MIFLKYVDTTNSFKDHNTYGLSKFVINDVTQTNVVQLVMDNGSIFVKGGKLLIKKCNLYWTLCAAYCIDLAFEDTSKRPSIVELITNARKITNFIYKHSCLLRRMQKIYSGGIVQVGATKFSINLHCP